MKKIVLGEAIVTNANNRKLLEIYFKDVENYKPLSKKEELKLFKRLKNNNDKSIIDIIVKHNLRFVISVAKKYQNITSNQLTLEDLICEGNVGLLKAIDNFDCNKDVKFISYAVWWIQQYITQFIMRNRKTIRVSHNVQDTIRKLKKLENELEQKYGRNIDENELLLIANEDGILNDNSKGYYKDSLRNNSKETSLSCKIQNNDKDLTLIDILKTDEDVYDDFDNKELKSVFGEILITFPNKIQQIFEMYYGFNGGETMNVTEIGKYFETGANDICVILKKYNKLIKIEYLERYNYSDLSLNNDKMDKLINETSKEIKSKNPRFSELPKCLYKYANDENVVFLI